MEIAPLFFGQLALILIAARVMGDAAARFGIPSVLGELATGILIGPSILGWIEPGETLHVLAEVGIVLMLFQVGLETDVHGTADYRAVQCAQRGRH